MLNSKPRNRIKELRVDRGLTQEALAERAHRGKSTVARIDSNPNAMPSLETGLALAEALGVQPKDLIA